MREDLEGEAVEWQREEGTTKEPEEFVFDEKTHSYYLNGKPMTGITTVIGVLAKPALIQWAANEVVKFIKDKAQLVTSEDTKNNYYIGLTDVMLEEARTAHNKKRDTAASHGTDYHALVEEWIKGALSGRVLIDEKFKPIAKFIMWTEENVDHFLFTERRMYNKELFLAGTADFAYVSKDSKRMMGDFKTSSGIYGIDYWLQVAGYRLLAESHGDIPYEGSAVVRLGKDKSFEAQYRYDYETDKEAFLACLKLYRAQATFKKPKY